VVGDNTTSSATLKGKRLALKANTVI